MAPDPARADTRLTTAPTLVDAVRDLLDHFAFADVPTAELEAAVSDVRDLAARFAAWRVDDRIVSGAADRVPPGRAALQVPLTINEHTATTLAGEVRFRPFHVGSNGAAHGGAIPLLFDDVLGRLVNAGRPTIARTACLTTNYRSVTWADTPLRIDATLDREEGRKRWASARLRDGESVVAECDALFVELRPGRP